MKMRWLAALAAITVLGAACQGAGNTGGGGGGAAPDSTFTYSVTSEVVTEWDPAISYSNEMIALQNIYETLTRYDADTQTAQPLLATAWEASDDGLTWTFTLREGVTFHTGRALDSTAVKESIQRTIDLGQSASYIWGAVESIDTPDPQTVVFNLAYSSPLDLVASGTYAAYVYDVEAAGGADLTEWFNEGNDAGSGPYKVGEWNKGAELELRLDAYEGYWGGWDGDHYTTYDFRVVPEVTTAQQLLEAGQIDAVQRLNPQIWQSFEGREGFQTTTQSSWQTLLAMFNTASGPLADPTVRRAIAQGIDYDGIIAALQGAATGMRGYIPPGLWGSSDALPAYEYDPAGAAELLGSKGYGPDGQKLELELTYVKGDADEEIVATLMQSTLADLNIDLQVRGLQWEAQWAKAQSEDKAERQDILVFYWWPDYPDPISWFYSLFRTEDPPYFNLSYYANPEVDALMDEGSALAATDKVAATEDYVALQQQLLEDLPAVSLYTQAYQRVLLDSVGNYVDNPAYPSAIFAYDLTPGL